MRYLIILFTLFLTFVGKSQTGEVVGAGYVISSSGSDPNFTVTFSYTSALGWSTSDISTDHFVMVRAVIGPTHSRNIYDITSVSPAGGNVTLGLTRITGTATATFPSGTHPIIASPGDGILYDAPNISQMHDSYLYNYNLNKLFGNEYNTFTVSGDSVFIHNGNGDSLYVGADISAVAVQFLNDLDDVTIAAPGSGQVLVHDGVDWKNKTMTGNVVISGAGVTTISNNAVTNPKLATMPSMTIKGNNEVTTGSPEDLTTSEVKVMLDIDHLITLSGVPAANNDLGAFTGTTIPDNSNNKEALQALEAGVEAKLPKSLPSAQIYVGNAIGNATAVTMSGDATISNTGVVDVPGLDLKNTNIQFKDEGVNLGTAGTVDEVDFTGAGVTATRLSNKITVDVTSGGGGATNLTYTASPTQGQVNSDTGTDAILPVVDVTNAGLVTPDMLDNFHDSLTVDEQANGVDLSFTGTQQLAVDLNPNELTLVTAAPTDVVIVGDASDSYLPKKALVSDFGGVGSTIDSTTLSSVNGTIDITEVPANNWDIDVNIPVVRQLLDTCYAVTISGGNSGSELWVCSNGDGITASFSGGVLTVASTALVKLKNAYWKLVAADVQSGSDGAVTDWVRVVFTNTKANTGLTDIRVPTIGKTALPSGALSVTNFATYDIDNSPAISIVGVGSNSITVRASGVSATNGYQLSFTGVH